MMIKVLAKPVLILIILSTSLLGSSTHVRTEPEQFMRTELYFGRNISERAEVSRKDFDKFLAEIITPRFPDGLTVVNAAGQFLNSNGEVEKERTVILVLFYPVSARKDKHFKVEEIREAYKVRFQQQSVLRVDHPEPLEVSF